VRANRIRRKFFVLMEKWRVGGEASELRRQYPDRARMKAMKKHDDDAIPANPAPATPEEADPESGGQSGDTQGLTDVAEAGPESVEELVEEGQAFEAGVISGVENAPDADVEEVHTKQVRMDDVPPEYDDQDSLK
jgi:hypothetical protein